MKNGTMMVMITVIMMRVISNQETTGVYNGECNDNVMKVLDCKCLWWY